MPDIAGSVLVNLASLASRPEFPSLMRLRLALIHVLVTWCLAACADSPPPIGAHLPGVLREASDAFDQRVKARFPIGSDEHALRQELAKQNFVINRNPESPFSFTARYTANELVCRADWDIRWSMFGGKIESIDAGFGETCL
jgi:hypothetical protein